MSDSDILDQHITDAERALDAAAGSSSLCTLSRSGVPMPGIKYPEGAWVALREVRREMRVTGAASSAIEAVRDRWAGDLERHIEAASGPDWVAYLTGGLDALDALALDASVE